MTGARALPLFVVVVASLGATSLAEAQDRPSEPPTESRCALTFGYPGSGGLIGILWDASSRMALRSELSVSGSAWSVPSDATYGSYRLGLDVSLLLFVARRDNARIYVGPRFIYSRDSSTYADEYGVGGGVALGLQYRLARRIGIYGEVGVDYQYQHRTSDHTEPAFHAIASRNSVGLNLYF